MRFPPILSAILNVIAKHYLTVTASWWFPSAGRADDPLSWVSWWSPQLGELMIPSAGRADDPPQLGELMIPLSWASWWSPSAGLTDDPPQLGQREGSWQRVGPIFRQKIPLFWRCLKVVHSRGPHGLGQSCVMDLVQNLDGMVALIFRDTWKNGCVTYQLTQSLLVASSGRC